MALRTKPDRPPVGPRFTEYSDADRDLDKKGRTFELRDGDCDPARVPVPEDGKRDWVPTCDVRKLDAPIRQGIRAALKPHKRATMLLKEYLIGRIGCKDKKESAACRSFLRVVNEREVQGIDVTIMRAEKGAVQLYFWIYGVGPVVWLPVLVLPTNVNLEHIMRETGPGGVQLAFDELKADPSEEPRKGFPGNDVKVELIIPKRHGV